MLKINIDNIEEVYNTVKTNKFKDEIMYIKCINDLKIAMEDDHQRLIFLTDSVTLTYFNAKCGTAVYKSFTNDTKLRHLRIKPYPEIDYNNLFELVKDILVIHPNLRKLKIETPYNVSPMKKILSEDQWILFCQGLKQNRTLKELIIIDSEFDRKIARMLAEAINEHKHLSRIKLCVPPEVRQILLASLEKNSTVQILQIGQFQVALEARSIKELFEINTTMHTLILRGIIYTDEDVDPFMSLLQTSKSLQTLEFPMLRYIPKDGDGDIYETTIRGKILPRLIDSALKRPQSPLRTLNIPNLYAEELNILLEALISNSSLTSLHLGRVTEGPDGFYSEIDVNPKTIEIWNELLTKNNSLKEISLNGVTNQTDHNNFFSIDWFKCNKTLTKLDLRANRVADALLGDTLRFNKTLKALKLTRSCMPDRMWQSLLTNTTLTDIDISDIENNEQNDTSTLLQHNSTVRTLTSTVYYKEWDPLLTILSNNNTITSYTNTLDVGGSPTDFSVQTILSLKNNWALTHLDLKASWYEAFCEPILERNRQFKLTITLIMRNIARQKSTMFPMEIWRLIFSYFAPVCPS